MVTFSELRITDDKKKIYIGCRVDDLGIYSEMYIRSVELYYYRNANHLGLPKSSSVVHSVYDDTDGAYKIRTLRACVSIDDIFDKDAFGVDTFDSGLFYVKVECDGHLPADASLYACSADDPVDIGVIPDWKRVYDAGMQFVSYMNSHCRDICEPPFGFEQFILIWFGLRLALESADYVQIHKMWDRFLRISKIGATTASSSDCGCN